jgi:hypothetical protein
VRYVPCTPGVNTTDADRVAIQFDGGDLRLSFVDWQERPRAVMFRNVLAFRWQEPEEPLPAESGTFEAVDSPWLDRQARIQSVPSEGFQHYVVCFNASGVLDVLAGEVSAA